MAMGVNRITLDSLEPVSDTTFYVHGKNFTQSSKLIVSGKWYPTSYVDGENLLVTGVTVEDGAQVRVGQLSNSNSGKFLSYTNTLVYLSPEKEKMLEMQNSMMNEMTNETVFPSEDGADTADAAADNVNNEVTN